MSVNITYPLTTETNYSFDSDRVEVSGGKGKLKYIDNPSQTFNEDFADDTDFTYDSGKAEFTDGKVQQTNQKPANCTAFCNYEIDDSYDLVWGDGDLSGALYGITYLPEAGVSGGYLKVATAKYDPTSMDPGVKGTLRGVFQPRTFDKYAWWHKTFFFNCANLNGAEVRNNISLYLDVDGHIRLRMYDKDRNQIFFGSFGYFEMNQYQWYEVEFNFDTSAGQNWAKLFIDGVQLGSVSLSVGLRDSVDVDKLTVNHVSMYCNHWAMFDEVQHTSNYTPTDWSEFPPTDSIYFASTVELPVFTQSGSAELKQFDGFSTVQSGSPKYILNDKYFDGNSWVTSDGSYNQSNTITEINSNIDSLNASETVVVKVLFTLSPTQSYVDDLTIEYTGSLYSQENDKILFNSSFRHEGLEGFTEIATKPTGTEIKYILKKGNTWYYHDGADWVESDETYSQSNTATEIETYKSSFVGDVHTITYIKAFLHSEDMSKTPELDSVSVDYNFAGGTPDDIDICSVWGFNKHADGTVNQTPIKVRLNFGDTVRYKDTMVLHIDPYTLTPDSDGYWEVELVETINMSDGVKYVFEFGSGMDFKRSVPVETSKNFWELEE